MNPIDTGFSTPSAPPVLLLRPERQIAPVIFVSCHSGRDYQDAFRAQSRLDPLSLRYSEDCFVDDLFNAAPMLGAPLLLATFPRAYCDANREKWELDQAMFADVLPRGVRTSSPRIDAGLGTIARVVANGQQIYREKLRFEEAERRIEACWQPFHDQLTALIEQTRAAFGLCILIDCHSMPTPVFASGIRPAFVLGDAFGTSCEPRLVSRIEKSIYAIGEKSARNDPYAGGYITKKYGAPQYGVHALQIEIPRYVYLDEHKLIPSDLYITTKRNIEKIIRDIIDITMEL